MVERGPTDLRRVSSLSVGGAALYGDIGRREVTAVTSSRLDALQTVDDPLRIPEETGVGGWIRRTARNVWHEIWHGTYLERERLWSLQAHEAAGISGELSEDVRRAARAAAAHSVNGDSGRQRNARRQETRIGFTEYHREALGVLAGWRRELTRLEDPLTPAADRERIMRENPLYGQYTASLLSEEQIASNIIDGIVNTDRGEIVLDRKFILSGTSETGRNLITRVIKPYLRTAVARGNTDSAWLELQPHIDAVFRSEEFAAYVRSLSADERDLITTDRYATNLRSALDALVVPAHITSDFVHSIEDLSADIAFTMGIAETGPRAKIGPARAERLVAKNRDLYDALRTRNAAAWYPDSAVSGALIREQEMAARSDDILKSAIAWGAASTLLLYLPRWGVSRVGSILAPMVGGGIVAGGITGVREWHRLGKEYTQTDLEAAMGYSFPAERGGRASRRAELLAFTDQVSLQDRTRQLQQALSSPMPDRRVLYETMVDSMARRRISDRERINLLGLTPGSSPGSYDEYARLHDRLVAEAAVMLRDGYGTDQSFRTWINERGSTAWNDALTASVRYREDELLGVIRPDTGPDRSLAARRRAFDAWRLRRSVGRGAATFAVGAVAGLLVQEAAADIANHRLFTGEISRFLHIAPQPDEYDTGSIVSVVDGSGHAVRLPEHMRIDASGNLIDTAVPGKQTVIVTDIVHHVRTSADGSVVLDDAARTEALSHGITLGSKTAEPVSGQLFSGSTRQLSVNGTQYTVPSELHVVPNNRGTSDIVLSVARPGSPTPETIHLIDNVNADTAGHIRDADVLQRLTATRLITEVTHPPTPVPSQHAVPMPGIEHAAGATEPTVTLPEGARLTPTVPGHFDLIVPVNGQPAVAVHDIAVDATGKITDPDTLTNQIAAFNTAHPLIHLTHTTATEMVTTTSQAPAETIPVTGESVTWRVSDWNSYRGGLWDKLSATPGVGTTAYRNASVNGIKNLWRAYEENVVHYDNVAVGTTDHAAGLLPHNPQAPQLLWYNRLPGNVTFKNLPESLFGQEEMTSIAHRTSELAAIQANGAAHGLSNAQMYAGLSGTDKVMWDAGVWGNETAIRSLTPERMSLLMDWAGGTAHPGVSPTVITLHRTPVVSHVFGMETVNPPSYTGNGAASVTETVITASDTLPDLVRPAVPFIPIPLYRPPLETSTNRSVNPVWTAPVAGTPVPPPLPRIPPGPVSVLPAGGRIYPGYPASVPEQWTEYIESLRQRGEYPPAVPPEHDRSVPREQERILAYLDGLPADEKRRMYEYSSTLKPMEPTTRVAIVIPAYHEENGIYRTLEEWANQTDSIGRPLNKRLYEIDVLINREASQPPDQTRAEVEKFMVDYPTVCVNLIDMVFPDGQGGYGPARKLATDVTLRRSLDRGDGQQGPLYIESEDADLLEMDRNAVYRILRRFDTYPRYDALRGKQDMAPLILKNNDYVFCAERGNRLMEFLLRDPRLRPEVRPDASSRWNTLVTGGWNTAFTAESYALIGGYRTDLPYGEDVDIGSRISLLRRRELPDGTVIPDTHVIGFVPNVGQSNPRRFIHAALTGQPAYTATEARRLDDEIRAIDPVADLARIQTGRRINATNKHLFEDLINGNLAWLAREVPDPAIRGQLQHRYLMQLGLRTHKTVTEPDGTTRTVGGPADAPASDGWTPDYHFDNGSVVLDYTGNIASALRSYRRRTRGHAYRGMRPSPPPDPVLF